jgi:hypothetical protein
MQIGGQRADVAGAGFAESGSALDLLRSSAQQGALNRAVLGQQGLIQEAGYKEQAQSYTNMSEAATIAGNAENKAAEGADIGAAFDVAAAITSVFTPGSGGGGGLNLGNLFMGGGSPTGL